MTRRLSSFLPYQSTTSPLLSALKHPPVLVRLLRHLDWPDVHALLSCSQSARSLFRVPPLRNRILARFVPEYRACIAFCDPACEHDVPVDIHDLDLLCSCRVYPLLASANPNPFQ
jgi:hypothetical protein